LVSGANGEVDLVAMEITEEIDFRPDSTVKRILDGFRNNEIFVETGAQGVSEGLLFRMDTQKESDKSGARKVVPNATSIPELHNFPGILDAGKKLKVGRMISEPPFRSCPAFVTILSLSLNFCQNVIKNSMPVIIE